MSDIPDNTVAASGSVTDAALPERHPASSPGAASAPAPAQVATAAAAPRRFDVDCRLDYQMQATTHFLLQIEAAHTVQQTIETEQLVVTPAVPLHRYEDDRTGNRFVRFDAPPGPLSVAYVARIALHPAAHRTDLPEQPVNRLPDDTLRYLMPTRYCESDHFSRAAQRLFGDVPQGSQRVAHICDWIHENIEYKLGTSDATTAARDVFLNRAGVCRDFAHLGITFCRALNIPARLVVGYVHFDAPPPDFHAIFEAFLGGEWVLFDPTRLAPPERLVRIGTGRDAKDVAFATLFGPATMLSMAPRIEEVKAG